MIVIKKLVYYGLGIFILIMFLSIMYQRSQGVDSEVGSHIVTTHSELVKQEALLDKVIVETWKGIHVSFDPLVSEQNKLTQIFNSYLQNIDQQTHAVLHQDWQHLGESFSLRSREIESFKSGLALLRNSLKYVLVLDGESRSWGDEKISNITHDFVKEIYATEYFGFSLKVHQELQNLMQQLDEIDSASLAEDQANNLLLFILHAKKMIEMNKDTQEHLLNIMKVNETIGRLMILLEKKFLDYENKLDTEADYYLIGLSLFASILMIVLTIILIRQVRIKLALEQSQQSSRLKSEFLSSMSHEFRTPLNAIIGFGQLLEMTQDKLDKHQRENIEQIMLSSRHLLDLINQLLDLSYIESGKLTLSLEVLDPVELIEHCVAILIGLANSKSVSISIEKYEKCEVIADKVQLKQVVINLLSNAIKYNVDGGEVEVSCRVKEQNYIRISIKDSGIGIAEHKHQKLFQSFSRLGQENSAIQGAGVGLVVTQHLIEAMEGNIGFESVEGVGSTFWFDIPIAK